MAPPHTLPDLRAAQVNFLPADKQKFILKALSTCRSQLDSFLSYLPKDAVQEMRKLVAEENELNKK